MFVSIKKRNEKVFEKRIETYILTVKQKKREVRRTQLRETTKDNFIARGH